MSNKVARAGKFVVFVASRLEKHGKCRPSGGKWWQVAWQFAGIFQIFPLPLYPKSPFLGTFRAARCAKSASQLRKQPPPPYAPKRLARLAIAEYVTNFCHSVCGLFRGSVIFARPRKWWGASAVVAALWSDKPLHIQCAMAYHLHQCRKLWVQGCLQYYRLPAPYLWP